MNHLGEDHILGVPLAVPQVKQFRVGDAGAISVEDILPLLEALRTAHEVACGCCDSSQNVYDHCREALKPFQEIIEFYKEVTQHGQHTRTTNLTTAE